MNFLKSTAFAFVATCLFTISAHAQTPVYGSPVFGTPGNPQAPSYPYQPTPGPVYGSPVFGTPGNPQAPALPLPPIYSPPSYGYGYPESLCQVMLGGNAYGQTFYRVIDAQGRILNNSCSYEEALEISQNDARCYDYQ